MFAPIVPALILMAVGGPDLSTEASRAEAPEGLAFQAGFAVGSAGTWATEFYLRQVEAGPSEWVARRSLVTPAGREQISWATASACPVISDVATSLNRLDFGPLYVPPAQNDGPRLFAYPTPSSAGSAGATFTVWGASVQGGGFAFYKATASAGAIASWASAADEAMNACWDGPQA